MADYDGVDPNEGADPVDEKFDELVLDALDERRLAAIEDLTEDEECPGSGVDENGQAWHCGNDCGGISANDGTGEYYEAEECVHCDCCTCTPCSYARVG